MSSISVEGRTPEQWREIALSQAETLNKQATNIRDLIRERDAAKEDRSGALLLAATYADKAGVQVEPAEAEQWLHHYHERLARGARDLERQHGQLWDVLGIARQLQKLGAGERRFGGDVAGLAARVAEELNRVATVQGPKPAREMFEQPAVPGLGDDHSRAPGAQQEPADDAGLALWQSATPSDVDGRAR